MLCNVRRSQYEGFWGTIYFTLDVAIEPTADEAELIEKHDIGPLVVFDSEQRKQRMQAAQEHAESTSGKPLIRSGSSEDLFFGVLSDIGSTLYNVGAGAYNLALGSLAAQVTVQSLIEGAHLESDNANEILDAERIITKCIDALKVHLEDLQTFDGREELYEP